MAAALELEPIDDGTWKPKGLRLRKQTERIVGRHSCLELRTSRSRRARACIFLSRHPPATSCARGRRPQVGHGNRAGAVPLTTFILTYALAHNKLAIGLAAVGAILGGVIVTIASFAVAAVYARTRFMTVMDRTEGWRMRVGFWAELLGAIAVVLLGLLMLRQKLTWLPFA